MPRVGRAPKEDATRRRTNSPDEWLDVPNVPYRGKKPRLPATRATKGAMGAMVDVPYLAETREWWRVISSMPHAALWDAADWQFALATAVIADQAFSGSVSAASHLLMRGKILGDTSDARRALRIRYTDPDTGEVIRTTGMPTGRNAPSMRDFKDTGVANISDYRDL